jgi:beta-lactamase class A
MEGGWRAQWSKFVITVVVFVFGALAGYLSAIHDPGSFSEARTKSRYTYINPLLECDQGETLSSGEFKPSRAAVQEVIDQRIEAGDVSMVSVYFRDMNNGPWFGIDQNEAYAASSMLKVAHLMAVLKASEQDSTLLERELMYEHVYRTEPQTFVPRDRLIIGNEYTVKDLLERLIVYSDNEVLYLLQDKLPVADTTRFYAEIGMEFNVNNEISVKSYSSLFRILFNASYLSAENSEYALDLLTRTDFSYGLHSGVPVNIPVAHKFGERFLENPYNQLHDCGIVYYPNHPYLLCVMTRGSDPDKLVTTIKDISYTVYSQMQSVWH